MADTQKPAENQQKDSKQKKDKTEEKWRENKQKKKKNKQQEEQTQMMDDMLNKLEQWKKAVKLGRLGAIQKSLLNFEAAVTRGCEPKPKSDLPTLDEAMSALSLDPSKIGNVERRSAFGPIDGVDPEDIYLVRTVYNEVERCVRDDDGMTEDEKIRIGELLPEVFLAINLGLGDMEYSVHNGERIVTFPL